METQGIRELKARIAIAQAVMTIRPEKKYVIALSLEDLNYLAQVLHSSIVWREWLLPKGG